MYFEHVTFGFCVPCLITTALEFGHETTGRKASEHEKRQNNK